jgi:hypothetical protein
MNLQTRYIRQTVLAARFTEGFKMSIINLEDPLVTLTQGKKEEDFFP